MKAEPLIVPVGKGCGSIKHIMICNELCGSPPQEPALVVVFVRCPRGGGEAAQKLIHLGWTKATGYPSCGIVSLTPARAAVCQAGVYLQGRCRL
jgi:hypothetical protein